jgi:hypothetical protein
MAGSFSGGGTYAAMVSRSPSEQGSILHDQNSVSGEDFREEVLLDMFLHAKGKNADTLQELTKSAQILFSQQLSQVQQAIAPHKGDPQRYISSLLREMEDILKVFSHKYFFANWKLQVTHESIHTYLREQMNAVKQQLNEQTMGSSTHMPQGYEHLDEQKLAEYNILVAKRIRLLLTELIKRTNESNEDRITNIKQLKVEKKQREDSVDQSEEEKNESEGMIASITENIKHLENGITLHKIGIRMFGEKIDLRELELFLKCELLKEQNLGMLVWKCF